MTPKRRDVLRGIGTGTALLAGATGSAAAVKDPFADDNDGNAEVRVIHASPDAPAVDVFADGNKIIEGITFKTVTDYLSIPAGTYNVKVSPSGAGPGNAVIDTDVTVEADTDYTIAATKRLANITATVFVDDNTPEPRPRVRAVHLSPDAPAVDVALSDGPGVVFGPEVVVSGLTFQNASGYLNLVPTDYEFQILPSGGDDAVAEFEGDLEVGAVYSAFAVGLLEPDSEDQAFDVVLTQDVGSLSDRLGSGH